MTCSLANFEETDPKASIDSPRSLRACKQEGVLPQELVYKPIEAFQERNLSPRLVKLRYDFFEAKRRDLLTASRRARDAIVAEDRREAALSGQTLSVLSKESGLSKGALMALKSDGLKQERMKLQRAQERERSWLKSALDNELRQLKIIESKELTTAENDNTMQLRQQEMARRMKEVNDRKVEAEERKQLEAEARLKLEKQIAKEELLKQQQDRQRQEEEEARRQKELYRKQVEEMERKKQAELDKQEKKELAFREQEARKAEMRAQELRRLDVMEQQRQAFQDQVAVKKDERHRRVQKAADTQSELDRQKRQEFAERQAKDKEREERLMTMKALEQEECSKKAMMQMMKRKMIQEDANRKQEDRRTAIMEQQEENEMRLLEHEQKKERYLEFKRELDTLKGMNKEINVERQRRREEAQREQIAEQVRRKDQKVDALNLERKRLWQIRKAQQTEAYKARENVRAEIMKQRVQSKYNSKILEDKMRAIVLKTSGSASMPSLRNTGGLVGFDVAHDEE